MNSEFLSWKRKTSAFRFAPSSHTLLKSCEYLFDVSKNTTLLRVAQNELFVTSKYHVKCYSQSFDK